MDIYREIEMTIVEGTGVKLSPGKLVIIADGHEITFPFEVARVIADLVLWFGRPKN